MALAEVVGYTDDGSPIVGDVMGDEEVGRHHHAHRRHMALPARPQWRAQLAPGVIQPDEGMVPLPMTPLTNGGTFTAAIPNITWQGQLQKPFRPERLLVSVVRSGASAVGRLLGQSFIGTDLGQADIAPWDIELVGQAMSFGTRLTNKAAEPGV